MLHQVSWTTDLLVGPLCAVKHKQIMWFIDENECDKYSGGCSHTCVNDAPGYHCECPEPLELNVDGKKCIGELLYSIQCAKTYHNTSHEPWHYSWGRKVHTVYWFLWLT